MQRTLLQSGNLVTETGIVKSDLLIEDSKIIRIDKYIEAETDMEVLNLEGKIIMPGIIDPHVHINLKAYNSHSADDFYTGSRAAAAGGVTTFIDFAIPEQGESLIECVENKKNQAEGASLIDYSFHGQIVHYNEQTVSDMERLVLEGISSFKVFIPSTEGWAVDDYGLLSILKHSAALKGLVMVHAENGSITSTLTENAISNMSVSMKDYPATRPDYAELEAVQRACLFANEAQAPIYICHLSTSKAAVFLRKLRRQGQTVFVETCPQYLLLDDQVFNISESYLFACCPPIRKKEDNHSLWRSILEMEIDVVATDHCPFTLKQKESPGDDFTKIPFGLPGLENSLELMLNESCEKRGLDIEVVYNMQSLNPAKIFGLYPKKGTLRIGSDADLVIIDPHANKKIKREKVISSGGWSPYEGWDLNSSVLTTISRGEVIYSKGKFSTKKGRGQFIKRSASSYYSS